jgi:hypothetical protein
MGSKRRSSRGEAHIRAAEGRGEPLKHYAARKGLSAHSLYEAKRVLRERGVIAPAAARKRPRSPRFARVEVIGPRKETPVCSLRVRLASGAELEWSEAPSGEALRELVECLGR